MTEENLITDPPWRRAGFDAMTPALGRDAMIEDGWRWTGRYFERPTDGDDRYAGKIAERRALSGRYAERLPTNRRRKRERAKARRRERKTAVRLAAVRTLAARWSRRAIEDGEHLDPDETEALFGWVRERMTLEVEARRADYGVGTPPTPEEIGRRRDHSTDPIAIAQAVADDLGITRRHARSLCEAAGRLP